jgi:hypothetical protein
MEVIVTQRTSPFVFSFPSAGSVGEVTADRI